MKELTLLRSVSVENSLMKELLVNLAVKESGVANVR